MSLNWKLTGIQNYETVCLTEDGCLKGATECLIWYTLFLGHPLAKESDFAPFLKRLRAYEEAGFGITYGNEPIPEEVVRAHVGLHTNGGKETARAFNAKLKARALEEARERARKAG